MAEQPALAVVDMDALVQAHPKAASNRAIFRKQLEGFEAEKEAMIDELKSLRETYMLARREARDPAISDSVRNERETEARKAADALQDREETLSEKAMERQRELGDQKVRMYKMVEEEVRKLISAYAREAGIGLVLDRTAVGVSGPSVVVYFEEALDITEEILERIDAEDED